MTSFKESWTNVGCAIMPEEWGDGNNCIIIKFIVSFPQGTMFLKLVDAFDKVKDANLLFYLLDELLVSVGVENVVQFIIDNASY